MSFLEFAFLGKVEPFPEIKSLTQENETLKRRYQASEDERLELIRALALLRQSERPSLPSVGEAERPADSDEGRWERIRQTVLSAPRPLARAVVRPFARPSAVDEAMPSLKERTQSKAVMVITWSMLLILLLSLCGIILLSVMKTDVPDILTVCVSSPLGYFGGLLSAYFGVQNR